MVRNNNLDWLKLVLALMVVGIHYGDFLPVNQFIVLMLDNGIFRIAVPIFFIFNGYFIYNAIQKGNELNYIKRILYLYIFWSLIYLFYFLTLEHRSVGAFFSNLIFGFNHLWYLPAVIMASLLIIKTNKMKDSTRTFSFIGLFIIGTCIQYSITLSLLPTSLMGVFTGRLFIYRNGIFFAPIFMLMGYLFNKYKLTEKIRNQQTILPLIIGIVLLVLEAFFNSHYPDAKIDMMFSLLLICPALFLFAFTAKKQLPALNGDIPNAIYFTHPFILFGAQDFHLKFENTLLIYCTVTAIIVLFMIKLPKKVRKVVL